MITFFKRHPLLVQDGWGGKRPQLAVAYLRLRNSCKKAYMYITSDSDGDLTVSLKMVFAGQADPSLVKKLLLKLSPG